MSIDLGTLVPIKKYIEEEEIFIKLLLWGDSGSGKTHTSATIASEKNKVAIALSELQGKLAISNATEYALVQPIADVSDLYKFIRLIKSGKLKEEGVDCIVFDSLTEIQRLFADEIKGDSDTLQIKDYLLLHERMLKFLRYVRGLEYHVVCTALAVHKTNEQDGSLRVEPMFIGQKMCNMIAQFFNLVGYMDKAEITKDDVKKLRHRVILNSTSAYITKGTPQLNAIEEPNLRMWVEKIASREESNEQNPHTIEEPKPTQRRRRRR
tara:strand:- start:4369 stop:5166 length:798 start_codon:yes stop_codon:yes gene_type:complete